MNRKKDHLADQGEAAAGADFLEGLYGEIPGEIEIVAQPLIVGFCLASACLGGLFGFNMSRYVTVIVIGVAFSAPRDITLFSFGPKVLSLKIQNGIDYLTVRLRTVAHGGRDLKT